MIWVLKRVLSYYYNRTKLFLVSPELFITLSGRIRK